MRWLVGCVYCDWLVVVDDPLDGADKALGHAETCTAPPQPSPFAGTGVGAS